MKIVVDHIHEKPLALHAEEPVELFPLLVEMQNNGECTFTAPIRYDILASREHDHLRVSGSVNTTLSMVCSRCLVNFDTLIGSTFTIFFRKGTLDEALSEEETELNEQDLISATYSGNEIDLTHEIEEQVSMEVPIKPLCGESCKGLCPECGTDLNQSSCSCSGNRINIKFSALKDFKVSR
jgi:uncharacterized protein